ncbi:MAG: InlB B-repeat-containing protein [Ruminococcus sp.]|nr:InlB B-repeat-containing protein [Ruminococcus sp.]
MDAYFNPDAATNFPIGTDTPFTFTADFSQAESGSTLSYAVTGSTTGINTSGSLTASNNSFSLVASFDNLTVTFTAVCGETEKTMTYTITGSGQPVAQIGSTDYYTLEDALKASVSGNTVVLLRDYTMYTGSKPRLDWATNNNGYTVKSGVKLLIPYNDAHTFIDNSSVKTNYIQYQKTETVVRYCTLTLPQGKMMYVNGGEVSVASRVYCMSTGQNGAYGSIDMKAGSNITFNSGSSLYAFGYITGTGTVTVNSGAKVYESMFVADYPGSASSTNSLTNAGVFPFAKFTVRNVEAPMTLNHGATEQVYFNMYGTSTVVGYKSTFVNFVGNSTSYLFSTSTGSSLTKSFVRNTSSVTDISNARQKVVINGNSSINSMSISISGYSVNTSSLNGVVIPYNFDITIGSGTTTLAENLIFCKGSTGTLNSGATLAINSSKNLYVLDASDDKHPNLPSGLADAKLDINGTISVSGAFYTSANNANVMSSGKTGKVIFNTAAGTATSLKVKSSNTAATAVTIKPAVLQNSSGTTDTAGAVKDNQFIYCSTHNQWEKTPVKVTFDANGGTGTMTAQSIIRATATALTANTFTRDGYTFSGWNTKADGTGTSYADKASVTLHEKADLTLYAKWQAKPQYTITWTWQTASGAASDTTTVYQGDVPTHAEAPAYSTVSKNYTFKAWSPAPTAATANKTYTATYTESVRQYPVTFDMQGHGTAPASQNVDYNTTATRPASPTVGDEVSEASGKYRFDGWYTDTSFNTAFDFNTKITGNTTVYAKWTGFYTVTFDKQGKGNDVSPIENVQSGSTISAPAYPEASVTTIDVGSDKYRFDGWYKEAACTNAWNFGTDTVTGATTIYAKWTQVNTVVFENSVVNTEEEEYVADNETVTIPDDPDGKKTAQYTYTFQGWSTGGENGTVDSSLTAGTVVVVNDDTTYTAIYEQTVNQYQYTFKNGDTVLKSDTVDYGTDPTYDGEEPAKVDITGQYTYSFDGWDYEYFCIDEDEEIPAGATKVKVEEGGASTGSGYKRELAASGAELGGAASTGLWKISGHADVIDDLPEVHGEMTVTAAYTESLTEYAITWKDGDGNTLKTDQVAYGSTPSYIGAAPTKTATAQYTYTFNNTWSPTITPVTGAATYTAQFDSTVNTYTVTWVVDGETSTATYSYGDTPSYDSTPTKDKDTQYAYTFSGWSPAITAVTGDVTYTAQFSTTSLAIKHSITLDGEIGVSFYIPTVSVDDPVNSTVALSWGPATGPDHGEATFSISDLTDSNANDTNVVFHGTDNGASVGLTPLAKAKINGGYYQFTAFVAAKQMADDITLNIYDTDHQAVLTDTYCVADYCYEVINGAKDCADDTAIENSDIYQRMYAADNTMTAEKFKDLLELCKALLTYGSKAQVQFSYNADADGLADKDLTDYTYTAATAADFESFYTAEYASGADSMTYYGSSMQLEAETTYTVWLRYTDQSYEPPAATATVKGQSVTVDTVKVSGSYDAYYVRYNIMNLPANLLTEDITVSYNNAETAKYNAKTYFYLALVSGNATLENTVTSLYNYNQAAVTYFGSGS